MYFNIQEKFIGVVPPLESDIKNIKLFPSGTLNRSLEFLTLIYNS